MSNPPPTALVTGASSGIGLATATALARAGYRVFGTCRRPGDDPATVNLLPLDVRDEDSVRACVERVQAETGSLDLLVNNAGVMLFGPVEEVPLADAASLFETNFWGVVRVTNAVLPSMRARGRGAIVNVGSIAGSVTVPLNGFYAATKHALVAYTEALRHEVLHTGVRVALVEPGDVRSNLWSSEPTVAPSITSYADVRRAVLTTFEAMRATAGSPEETAEAIVRLAQHPAPPLRTPVGAVAMRVTRMRRWMPASMFEAGTRRRFGLKA